MRNVGIFAAAAAVVGSVTLLFALGQTSAASLPGFAVAAPGDATMIQQVDKRRDRDGRHERDRRDHDRYRYDPYRHGGRYLYSRPGFDYYYDGYYYGSPWWIGPSVGFTVTVPPPLIPSGHVQWCLDRFRTYDVASDTYIGYDGYRYRCNSPYL